MSATLKKLMKPLRLTEDRAKCPKVIREFKPEKNRVVFSAVIPSSDGTTEYTPKVSFRVSTAVKPHLTTASINTEVGKIKYVVPTIRSIAKVRCNCHDYVYTFAKANEAVGAHYGREIDSDAIKGKGVGKPRNPKKQPGCCKHIRGLVHKMERAGYIEGDE